MVVSRLFDVALAVVTATAAGCSTHDPYGLKLNRAVVVAAVNAVDGGRQTSTDWAVNRCSNTTINNY